MAEQVKKDFSIAQAFKFGITKALDHFELFLGVSFINFLPFILALACIGMAIGLKTVKLVTERQLTAAGLTQIFGQNLNYHVIGAIAVCGILFFLLINLFWLGSTKIALNIYDNDKAFLGTMFELWPQLFSQIIATLLYIFMGLLGLILFVAPGIYFLVKYCFYTAVIADHKVGPLKAFALSGELTEGIKSKLLAVWVVIHIFYSIAWATSGWLGFLLAVPLVVLANVYIYRSLQKQTDHQFLAEKN